MKKIKWNRWRVLELLLVIAIVFMMVMIFSTNGCKRQVERPAWEPPPMPSAWECRRVVGDDQSLTTVQKCWDPDTDKCWYIATNWSGDMRIVETKCWTHPFQELK